MEAFKWIWKYLKEYKARILIGFFLVLSTSVLNMVNPYMSGVIVDEVIIGNKTDILLSVIAVMVGATLVKVGSRYVFLFIFESVSQNVVFTIKERIYSRIQELDFNFFDKIRTGDIMARMTGDMEAVRHFIAGVIYGLFEGMTLFIFATVILFVVNFKFALVMIAVTPLIGFIAYKMGSQIRPAFSAIREQFSKLNTVVQENISGNRVVKAFAKEEYEIDKFSKENEGFRQKNMEAAGIWEKYLPILDSLAGMLSVVMVMAGGIMVIKGSLSLGELVMFNGFVWALNIPMRMCGWMINDVQRFLASADKIMKLMNTKPGIKNLESPVKSDEIGGTVEFRNVKFSYGDEIVLKNVNFKVKPGQKVAFVGPTGSGKSTLVSLICRFYDCSEGKILIDGIDIKEMDIRKLRSNIAMAMQDVFLFSDTIEGNIAYGVPNAPVEQVVNAAESASAHEFITGFPEGYNTVVGERGVGLSGGQKQRIALSRALLKDPSILILDDTTSSVDIETEYDIQKSLNRNYRGRTTFIIAHRISSVKNTDIIFVLENGEIIEQGKHEELLEKRGYYYNIYLNQFGDFDNVCTKGVV